MASKKYQPKTTMDLVALCDDPKIYLGDIDTSLITDMSHLFSGGKRSGDKLDGIETWDTSKVEKMSYMFKDCLVTQDIGCWNVSNVKDMDYMFHRATLRCSLEKWNTSNVEFFNSIFDEARGIDKIPNWNFKSFRRASCFLDERDYLYLRSRSFFTKKKKVMEFFENLIFPHYDKNFVIESIHPYNYHRINKKRCTYVFKIKNSDSLFELIFERGWGDVPQVHFYSLESSEREMLDKLPNCYEVMKSIGKYIKVEDFDNLDYKMGTWDISFGNVDKWGSARLIGLNRALEFAQKFIPSITQHKEEIFKKNAFSLDENGLKMTLRRL